MPRVVTLVSVWVSAWNAFDFFSVLFSSAFFYRFSLLKCLQSIAPAILLEPSGAPTGYFKSHFKFKKIEKTGTFVLFIRGFQRL